MDTLDTKRHRSTTTTTTKLSDDEKTNVKIPHTIHRLKRKTSLETPRSTTKKLDTVKSTEFEPRELPNNRNQNLPLYSPNDESNLNSNDRGEGDIDDYTDRIFNYLGETYNGRSPTLLPSRGRFQSSENNHQPDVDSRSIVPVSNSIKPLLCAFCPYLARTVHEFQTHIAKHTEKNFRCLLCNCMYKYRRDCVTHMKRKHSNTVTGSISQYIQKINGTTSNNGRQPQTVPLPLTSQFESDTRPINPVLSSVPDASIEIPDNSLVEAKRYGCPYCSLMTKSTSSIYKHQARKHAPFPKIVHKYSTDDPTTRNIVAVLKQKTLTQTSFSEIRSTSMLSIDDHSNFNCSAKGNTIDLPVDEVDLRAAVSSSSSLVDHEELLPLVNRHRCAASKHITAHNVHSSSGRILKIFQCCLCGYRARHRSNVVRHVKKIHHHLTFELSSEQVPHSTIEPSILSTGNETISELIEHLPVCHSPSSSEHHDLIIALDEEKSNRQNSSTTNDKIANYSFTTTVQAPLVLKTNDDDDDDENNHPFKPYADIHLSINIFIPNKKSPFSDDNTSFDPDGEDNPDNENEDLIPNELSSHQQILCNGGSLYKPHKCCRCFYRSNWKTDMLHHIRLKHHIRDVNKTDYISMDFDTALRSFSTYEKTFGKVLKNRLLLPKIDYIDCSWEELKMKLFANDDLYEQYINRKKSTRQRTSSSSNEQAAYVSINHEQASVSTDNNQQVS